MVEQFPVGPERGWIPWKEWDPSGGKGRLQDDQSDSGTQAQPGAGKVRAALVLCRALSV